MDKDRADRLARLLSLEKQPGGVGAKGIARPEAAGDAPRVGDILDQADANLSRPPDVDAADWQKAHGLLFTNARKALWKLERGDRALAPDEGYAAEAVIIGDGTRPSFLLCGNKVADDDPFIGTWRNDLDDAKDRMAGVAAAVGRIQPENGHASNYIGTGTLVAGADEDLIVTNYHVIKMAEDRFDVAMRRTPKGFEIDGVLEIDFVGESCSLDSNRHRIVEVRMPVGFGETFDGYDVVVARLDKHNGEAALPKALAPLNAEPAYATGAMESLALVGFPAAPAMRDGDIDWGFVLGTLFANKFGVKRLAPGEFTQRLGSHPADSTARRAIGHDATTFGGASGSLVAAWLVDGPPCFAIHFGGATGASNYALSFAAARKVLEPLGVRFTPP